jgi:ATP-binding cassette subfamily B protein
MVADASDGPRSAAAGAVRPSGSSLLEALVIAARHHGVHLSAQQLIRDHLLEASGPSLAQLLSVAAVSGLRATITHLGWADLANLTKTLPALVLLRNGSAMVLRRVDISGPLPNVVLQDPNARADLPLVLDEARFSAAWTGEVVLLKRDYRIRDEDQPFGLRLLSRHSHQMKTNLHNMLKSSSQTKLMFRVADGVAKTI